MNNIEICLVYSLNIPDKSLWYITIVWKTWLHLASIHTKIHHPQLNTKYKRKGKGDLYLLKLATISGPQVQEMAEVMVQGKIFTVLFFGPDLFLVLHGLKKRNDSFVWLWLWHKNKICLFTWQFLDFFHFNPINKDCHTISLKCLFLALNISISDLPEILFLKLG